jgi:hypothetical protein
MRLLRIFCGLLLMMASAVGFLALLGVPVGASVYAAGFALAGITAVIVFAAGGWLIVRAFDP